MNIMFFTHALNAGGAEHFILAHLSLLDRHRYSPSVCVLHKPKGPSLESEVQALAIPIHCLGETHRPQLNSLVRLVRLLRAQKIDLIQSHLAYANVLARMAGMLLRIPVVTTEQTVAENLTPSLALLNRLTMRCSDAAIFISQGVQESFAKHTSWILPEQNSVIPNGINCRAISESLGVHSQTRQQLGLKTDAWVIGSVGRLEPVKGHSHLIDAFYKLRYRIPKAHLVLVGDGSVERALREQIQRLNLDQAVTLLGHRTDVHSLLGAFNLFVMPSINEGLGIALLEAMAVGLPVVASKTGGIPEVVAHGETGLLVPPADPEALAEAMLKLYLDPQTAKQMGQRGQTRAKLHFDIQQSIHAYETIYENCIAP